MTRKIMIIAAALIAAAVAVIVLIPHRVSRAIMVTAQFEDSVGLYVGNAVSVLGMPVGKVTSIVPNGSYVEVRLEISDAVDRSEERRVGKECSTSESRCRCI